MKKRSMIISSMLIAVLVFGIVFFNPSEDKRIPERGTYWVRQNSYYAVGEEESIELSLDCFLVRNGKDDGLDSISNMVFVDENGDEYKVLNKDYVVSYDSNVESINHELILGKAVLQLKYQPKESAVFTQISYEVDGTRYREKIGRIEIDCVKTSKKITAQQNRVSWVTITQPAIKKAEYIVANNSAEEIYIRNITYGSSGITIEEWQDVLIGAGDEIEMTVQVAVNEEEGVPIVYYLKPTLCFEINNQEEVCAFANISKEAFYGDKESICEYLYKLSK